MSSPDNPAFLSNSKIGSLFKISGSSVRRLYVQKFKNIETNNLHNAVIQIDDGKLKFQNMKSTPPLTFKFIES